MTRAVAGRIFADPLVCESAKGPAQSRSSCALPNSVRVAHLMAQGEDHIHRCFDGNRLTIQHVRAISPLLDSVSGGLLEHGLAADDAKVLNDTVFGDDGCEHDRAFNACLPCDRRIRGQNFVHEQAGGDAGRDLRGACWVGIEPDSWL